MRRSAVSCQSSPRASGHLIFCVHDGTGHVLNYRDLARHLGEHQPFYGIQCVGLDGEEMPFTRIDDMATHYVGEMRKIQPAGPYYIGGYSFGGRVAYVMAQQLRTAGEEVALLALIDTSCRVGQRRVNWKVWLIRHCARLRKLTPSQIPTYVGLRFQNLYIMLRLASRSRLFSAALRYYQSRGRPIPRFLYRPVEANDMISRTYDARTYDGGAVLFQAEPYAWSHPDTRNEWHSLVRGGLEVRMIPGNHSQIIKEPYVHPLAAELADCLEKRRADRPSDSEQSVSVP